MKLTIAILVLVVLVFWIPNVYAQKGDDPGIPDTVVFVASVVPGPSSDQLQMDIWVYSDEHLEGVSMGITWDNPKIQMDSAKATSLLTIGFALGPFFYEDGSITKTNTNQRFMLGGATLFTPGIPASSERRLWASYYFTATDWTESDCVIFDTLQYNAATYCGFSTTVDSPNTFVPRFEGELEVGVCGYLLVDPMVLNFNTVEGEINPITQSFAVNSDVDALVFSVSNSEIWLTPTSSSSSTPTTVDCVVDVTTLSAGSYVDTVTITSEDAENSPQYVAINLTVQADIDGDAIPDDNDNCPAVYNPGQVDSDLDDIGDSCDICPLDPLNDHDGDSHCANADNCPDDPNPDQLDTDGDGVGDICCCTGLRGNVDYEIPDGINIVDLTYLVAYLFTGGPPPPCFDEGDVDGNDEINIADLTYIVAYLFTGGPPPVVCP
ncbi:MAG: thrombospondin type 3 repeat-containing protein [candidate division Zixibacteria bacterium]|nr:thrombospondin type 3 repeat-containing protein [candidate division Zixibacteria bacterium]